MKIQLLKSRGRQKAGDIVSVSDKHGAVMIAEKVAKKVAEKHKSPLKKATLKSEETDDG